MVTTLVWSGDVDFARHDALVAQLDAALLEADLTGIVIDLSAVTFMDSTGLGILVNTRNAARDRGFTVALQSVPDRVQHVLSIAGLDGIFDQA